MEITMEESGQRPVMRVLMLNKGKWLTSREIAEKTKLPVHCVQNAVRRIRKGYKSHVEVNKSINSLDYVYKYK